MAGPGVMFVNLGTGTHNRVHDNMPDDPVPT